MPGKKYTIQRNKMLDLGSNWFKTDYSRINNTLPLRSHMMKSFFRVLVLIILFSVAQSLKAQPLPPAGGHGQTGDQVPGGGAPITSGLAILIGMGGAYAGKKVYDLKK